MTVQEILRKQAGRRVGYSPQSVGPSSWSVRELETMFRRLKSIPGKITAYFERSKIAAVFKSNHAKDPRDNYYLILAVDGTVFHVDY